MGTPERPDRGSCSIVASGRGEPGGERDWRRGAREPDCGVAVQSWLPSGASWPVMFPLQPAGSRNAGFFAFRPFSAVSRDFASIDCRIRSKFQTRATRPSPIQRPVTGCRIQREEGMKTIMDLLPVLDSATQSSSQTLVDPEKSKGRYALVIVQAIAAWDFIQTSIPLR